MTDIESESKNIPLEYGNLINGRFVESAHGATFHSINPATLVPISTFQKSNSHDVDFAVAAAKRAFKKWRPSKIERANFLQKIAKRIQENSTRLAVMESMDSGKPLSTTLHIDIPLVVEHFEQFAKQIQMEEESIQVLHGVKESVILDEPLGVIAQILPRQVPLFVTAWKIAPALAAGNTLVVKLAQETPLSAMEMITLIADILPDGVLNVLTGNCQSVTAPLASHPDVDKVIYSGPSSKIREMEWLTRRQSKPLELDTGTRTANILFDDADMDKSIKALIQETVMGVGQYTTSNPIAFIHEDVFAEAVERLTLAFQQFKVGNPLDWDTEIGPLAAQEPFERALGHYESVKHYSTEYRVLAGGCSEGKEGFYVNPTLMQSKPLSVLRPNDFQAPLLTISKFSSEQEVVALMKGARWDGDVRIQSIDGNRMSRLSDVFHLDHSGLPDYELYASNDPFGWLKKIDLASEARNLVLDGYRSTKNILMDLNSGMAGWA